MRKVMHSDSSSSHAQARVLAVDDEPMIRDLVRKVVTKMGHVCETADSTEAALDVLGSDQFDLVVADINMSGRSGLDLLDSARMLDPDLAVVMVSGVDDPATAEMALASGAYGYVVKPFGVTELQIGVSNALRRRELERRLKLSLHDLETQVESRTAELRAVADELRHSEQRFRSLAQASPLGILYIDSAGSLEYANAHVEEILGRPADALAGVGWLTGLESLQPELLPSSLQEARAGVPDVACEYEIRRPDQTLVWISSRIAPIVGDDGRSDGTVILFEDIGDRKRLESQLRHQAGHDHLTGLPNRREFRDRLSEELVSLSPNTALGVVLVDLDEFKLVNDTYGHEAGDQLIRIVAERLQQCVPAGAVVARLGGDEFVVLLTDDDRNGIEVVAESIRQALRTMVTIVGVKLRLSASIGVAVTTDSQATSSGLLRGADIAMHQAKIRRDAVEIFDSSMAREVARRLSLTSELRQAVDDRLITVHYQPVVDTKNRQLVGFEALARWTHHDWGRIVPDEFIPIAESSGLLHEIDRQVLDQALHQLGLWRRSSRIASDVFMSVNLSASQLSNSALPEIVRSALERAGIEGSALCLEITEGALVADRKRTIPTLEKLRLMGVRIAIDDFGTGHSALSYLGRIPVDVLKIDQTFIATLGTTEINIVQTIIELAHRFDLHVIAEGVEEPHQLDALEELDCDMVQGFLTGRPTPPDIEPQLSNPDPSVQIRRNTDPAVINTPKEAPV